MAYVLDTLDTTRIYADDPFIFSAQVSQLVYPSKRVSWRPASVILVPAEPYHFSFMAASLVHFPFNASFLLTRRSMLLPETLREIVRISPTGEGLPAQVYLIGPIRKAVEQELRARGYWTLRITSRDIFEAAVKVAKFRLLTIPSPSEMGRHHVIVVSGETGVEALSAPYYSAHLGIPILFVTRDYIPQASRRFMEEFPDKTYTLFGSVKTIGKEVEKQIAKIVAHVDRVSGDTPFEISVDFAKRPHTETQIGWGRDAKEKGSAFTFGTIFSWKKAVAGLLLAHLGKHTPLLLIHPDRVPMVVKRYLLELNPVDPRTPNPPFMHGYVLGNFRDITFHAQVELEESLILKAKH